MNKSFALIILIFSFNFNLAQQKKIGSFNYILLGEPTHGDGAVVDEKIKIIKQLHSDSDFKTILFEAGFYDNFKAWELYKNNNDIDIYNQSVFSIWSNTKAFQELLSYVKQNSDMKILGVDCQEGELFQQYYLEDLKELLNKNNISLNETDFQVVDKTLINRDLEYLKNSKNEVDKLYTIYNKFLKVFQMIRNTDFKDKVIIQAFKSSKAEVDYTIKKQNGVNFPVQNPRDQQMAENFIFLQKELKNEKLIFWAANYHIANDLSLFKFTDITQDYLKRMYVQEKELTSHNESSLQDNINEINDLQNSIPLGKILKEYYKDQLYSLAFTAYSGNYLGGHENITPILTPPQNSIEFELFSKNSKATLVDLKNYPNEEFYSSTLGYLPIIMKWKNVYDGIYFIPKMYPPVMVTYKKTSNVNVQINNDLKIRGIILNKLKKTPIAYADVYYKSNNKSVVANEKGEFIISKSQLSTDYLVVSAIGYKNDSIQVKKISQELIFDLIESSEKITQIEEVVIKSQKTLSAEEILEKAKQNVESNYIQSPYNQKFYVSVNRYNENDTLSYREGALVETFNKNGLNSSNNAEKGIFGEILQNKSHTKNSEKDKWGGVGNLWVQLNRDIILSKANVLYRTNSYDLSNKKIIEYDGRRVYKIDFVNNSPGTYSTGFGYPAPISSIGSIYIDSKSFAVLRYEHCIVRQVSQNKHMKYPIQSFHKIIETYKEASGKYFINFYKQIDKDNYLKDNKVIATRYGGFYLMSEDITVSKVKEYDRPIIKLKQDFYPKENQEFWKNNNYYIEDENYKFENCESK
ncbi:erythromycin esterase family protein [Chryseobacterium balustinum]|uniref:Erythromycin esterase n=1 Tax=Chryseobacterium balustinum TaxID=246 RepID=A0AAX2ISP0_9FLAO|nr:erythromycin esterase family protein [Chryseobacterium balustinum]SKC11934.1 Erythromycin esterase homolog [Chryseobacterium balustinum]SQA92740.1 Erythromycin esterase [Chryseobacterium balustinum]